MKIGMLHPFYHEGLLGGGETLIRQLRDYMVSKGHEVKTITYNLDMYNKWHKLGLSPYLQFRTWTSALPACRDVDIIHSHFRYATLPYPFLKKTLLTSHGVICDIEKTRSSWWTRKAYYRIQKTYEILNFKAAQRVNAVSVHVKKRLEEDMGIKDVPVIYNGVDLRACKPGENPYGEGFNIAYFGRLSYEKGADLLLRAKPKDVVLHFVGPSQDREYLAVLRSLSSGKENFHGGIFGSSRFSYLAHADILVLPSRSEGMSIAAVEALACGACIVSSDIPSLKEVLGDAALYFENGKPQDLLLKLQELKDNHRKRKRLRELAKKRAVMFDINKTCSAYLEIYEEMAP